MVLFPGMSLHEGVGSLVIEGRTGETAKKVAGEGEGGRKPVWRQLRRIVSDEVPGNSDDFLRRSELDDRCGVSKWT